MKHALLFPGQGAQYVGMGKDFYENFAAAREVFEAAEELLKRRLTPLIFEGPESELAKTINSQVAIYVVSMATLKVVEEQFPQLSLAVCAGLSLGEYSALTASKRLTFYQTLRLVQARANFMNDACEAKRGTMAAILGLEHAAVEAIADETDELWVANLNCPKQVVISGTERGVEMGSELARARGAKRVIPLQVHGAFHSGLMQEAEKRLRDEIAHVTFAESPIALVMNVPGDYTTDIAQIPQFLSQQVTQPVRWEAGIRAMERKGVGMFLEIGCGKTLTGFNRRIGVSGSTISIDKVADLDAIAEGVGC